MDVTQALATAANIMLLGMGCVFVFLGILVVGINLLAKIAAKYHVEEPAAAARPAPAPAGGSQLTPDVVAAISAAVHQFRGAQGGVQNKVQ